MRTLLLTFGWILFFAHRVLGQETWQEALARMPLPGGTNPLERNNTVRRLLEGLQPNSIVKALVVLPAVSDDFYLINRDEPALGLRATNLWQAIVALTNVTDVRATFKPPFLLLHRAEDFLEPKFTVNDPITAQRLKTTAGLSHVFFCDAHWKKVKPILNKTVRPSVYPWSTSQDAWHFARHNLSGWEMSDWELVIGVSLSGKT